jgi:hypothetical protein
MLEVGGGRHAAGRAHADDRTVTAAPGELEQRRSEIPNAGHAVGVPDRHRASVDVRDDDVRSWASRVMRYFVATKSAVWFIVHQTAGMRCCSGE